MKKRAKARRQRRMKSPDPAEKTGDPGFDMPVTRASGTRPAQSAASKGLIAAYSVFFQPCFRSSSSAISIARISRRINGSPICSMALRF